MSWQFFLCNRYKPGDKRPRSRILCAWKLVLFCFSLFAGGCATSHYKTHYGVFEAENSAGEVRLFRVYWQTVRYQSWSEDRYQAFPLILETQCSRRDLIFYDETLGSHQRCDDAPESGIHYCANAAKDESRRGTPVKDNTVCATITDRSGANKILDLDGELLITLECQPKVKEKMVDGKKENSDFLLGSSLPYIVSTKSVDGVDLLSILPQVSQHSSICDPSG